MKHINLVRKITWSFHKTTGLDWDDLFQEGYLAYQYALGKYDPEKGKLSTFLWIHINNHLITYCKKHRDANMIFIDFNELTKLSESPEYFKEKLSKDAQEIAELALKMHRRLLKMRKAKVIAKIENIMLKRGWNYLRTYRALNELRLVYSS